MTEKKNKTLKQYLLRAASAVLLGLSCLLHGCEEGDITNHPLWLKGSNAEAAGDYVTAEEIFSRLARVRPDTVAVHIKLAELNDERLNDPFRAAEEYAVILKIDPDHPEAEIYSKLLRRARRESCNIWLLEGSVPPPENALPGTGLDPVRELQLLRRENAIIRYQLRESRSGNVTAPAAASAAAATVQPQLDAAKSAVAAAVPEQKFYTVVSGDTPEGISRKLYGTSRYAQAILAANKDLVKSARDLQIGQRLRLPETDAE